MYHTLYDIILPEPSMFFHVSRDSWLSLTLTLCSKNRKVENKLKNKNENRSENKEKLSLPFVNLTSIVYKVD